MGQDALQPDRLSESHIDLHDRQHFEIAFNYDASPALVRPDGRVRFRVDAFFFLPSSLGVSALSYGKDDFFKDVLSYLRFKTPDLDSQALADPLNPLSPLNVLSFNLKQLVELPVPDPALETSTVHEAKLLGCILIANWRDLRKQARTLVKALSRFARPTPGFAEAIADLRLRLEAEHALLMRYRGLRRAYTDNQASLPGAVLDALRVVDEYLTYRFDENLGKIHEAFSPLGDAAAELEERLRWLGSYEALYRQEEGFVCLSSSDLQSFERYTYRTGALKKHLAEVLFLDVQTVREVRRYRGLVAALGAGLAAFWSTLGDRNVNVQLHGVSTAALILIVVLVYILKDRIKEFFKDYVATQVQRLLPDQRMTITDPMTRQRIGSCRQTVRYERKRRLAADIRRVREFTHTIDLDEAREEEVLSYRHDMTLEARRIHATHSRRMHVKHILRYSVANLLRRLSDPHVKVSRFNPRTGRFEVVMAPKVYHVNVVFRVAAIGPDGRLADPVYHRLRVILNKDGIDRVEKVVQNKHMREIGQETQPEVLERADDLSLSEAEDLSPS
ncbi:MAG TPA: hypothetical protein V6D00_13910 [Pantanalinema sp.]